MAAETDLRQEHEQQLTAERQQWSLERDALQRVLQEQQGTAHTVEQQLGAEIADLKAQLLIVQTGHARSAQMQQDTLLPLQAAHQRLEQQNSKLQQDLQAALAYRHKCLQQKKELQHLRQQTEPARAANKQQLLTQTLSSCEQPAVASSRQSQSAEAAPPEEPVSQEDLTLLVPPAGAFCLNHAYDWIS